MGSSKVKSTIKLSLDDSWWNGNKIQLITKKEEIKSIKRLKWASPRESLPVPHLLRYAQLIVIVNKALPEL